MPVVRLEHVSFAYDGGGPVLTDVNLSIDAGEFVGVAGPNGGGKTTLVRLIVGLERASSGRVEVFGEPVEHLSRRSRIGYLPQRAQLGLEAPITVEEVVAAGRVPARSVLARPGAGDRAAITEAIERVGLTELASWPLQKLSGGQQQRAFIAKAVAAEPELLILDEPTTGVDAQAQESLAGLIDTLSRELGVAVLYVSHEFGAIEPYVERLLLVRGRIAFDGAPAELDEPWHDPSHAHAWR